MVDKICTKWNLGYPLDSITITPEYNKYTVELSDLEKDHLNKMCHEQIYKFITTKLGVKG